MYKQFFTNVILLAVELICSITNNANILFDYNLLTVGDSPKRTWINYVDVSDSSMVINLSANNIINDSTFASWINIDPQTFIQIGDNKYRLDKTDGIAVAPEFTYYDKANQTLTFNLVFSLKTPIEISSFSLIESESSDWRFNEIKLHSSTSRNSFGRYYAPHKLSGFLGAVSDSLMRIGEFEETIEINTDVLSNIEQDKIMHADNLKATASFYLAGCYNNLHDEPHTLQYALSVIETYRNNHWNEDIAIARMYGILADVYARNDDYSRAVEYGNEALRIKLALYPNGSIDLALSFGKLSFYYERVEDYEKAITCAEYGLILRERLKNSSLRENLPVVTTLCRNYFIKQRYADAINLALRYKTEETKQIDKTAYLLLCAICSHSYRAIGNEDDAKLYASEGYAVVQDELHNDLTKLLDFLLGLSPLERITIEESLLRNMPKEEQYFGIKQNLAQDYAETDNYTMAIEIQKECIQQRNELGIHNITKECEGLHRLSDYFFYSNQIDKYEEIRDQVFKCVEEVFGRYSYEFADVLRTDFLYFYSNAQYNNALQNLNKMLSIYKMLIFRDFPQLTYDDRAFLYESFRYWFDEFYLDCHLSAILHESTLSDVGNLNSNLYNNILFFKGLLTNSQVIKLANEHLSSSLEDNLIKNEKARSILENRLFGNVSDISQSLDSNSVAIEFIQVNSTNEIIALILPNGAEHPMLEYVCKVDSLTPFANNHNISIHDFSEVFWRNLAKHIKGYKNVYLSLDGILNILPIEISGLQNQLINPDINFYRVSSTRQLIQQRHQVTNHNYLLIGGLNYHGNVKSQLKIKDLYESGVEIDQISRLASEYNTGCTVLQSSDGTKTNIINGLLNKPDVAHFVTHTYYWTTSYSPGSNVLRYFDTNSYNKHITDLRLTRSGLILSEAEDKENSISDYLLNSYEIANLNLTGIDLVSLPTCKSALGDVTKDGIVGLQRAFKEAQVNSVLMSLWNADEISSRLLMVEFYKNLLEGKSKVDALRLSQDYIKNMTDETGKTLFSAPYYWAGFILLDALD